ncbi:uncharacterized protein LOC111066503 [Drosophila obscura]|uniref:uncharacterized protein LOC111066503 n=1 Tax=Drosophila obscura TaxID=7282 RepID=UPI001BB1C0A0|nr:uncharacterized protein LOC111066503 [Drosophila obscura]
MKKMDVPNDTKGIENLLKSEGITDYDPGLVKVLLNKGYSLIKEELLQRKKRADIAKAVGNIDQSSASAKATDAHRDNGGPGTSSSAMTYAQNWSTPMDIEDSYGPSCSAWNSAEPMDIDVYVDNSDTPGPSCSDLNSDKPLNSQEMEIEVPTSSALKGSTGTILDSSDSD